MKGLKNVSKESRIAPGIQRSYSEVIAYLNKHWQTGEKNLTVKRMKKLDQAFGSVSKKINAVLVAGTNGKSLTIHFAAKLLQEEGIKVGSFMSPHALSYNERISINQKLIQNKTFTEFANKVIDAVTTFSLNCNSYEILTMIALLYFDKEGVGIALMEVNEDAQNNATNICNTKIVAVTRATAHSVMVTDKELDEITKNMACLIRPKAYFVSGDQNKNHLSIMQKIVEEKGGHWMMPIRKLAPLSYPFGQLYGRCAAIAERIAFAYANFIAAKDSVIVRDSILVKQKGQRGRPTIEAKKISEMNPKKTTEQFWKETESTLPGRFQILSKEKPTILLDNADNMDAFENLLLGVRLLNYKRPLKGLTMIIGAAKNKLHNEEFIKLLRYFFKKTSGELFICPIENPVPGNSEEESWDVEQFTNDCKGMKVKARVFHSFDKAFDVAKTTVDEKSGLLLIAGSQSIINSYWKNKGIKKLG